MNFFRKKAVAHWKEHWHKRVLLDMKLDFAYYAGEQTIRQIHVRSVCKDYETETLVREYKGGPRRFQRICLSLYDITAAGECSRGSI